MAEVRPSKPVGAVKTCQVARGWLGAGVGGGFTDTQELRVMKYREAMKTKDKAEWDTAVME